MKHNNERTDTDESTRLREVIREIGMPLRKLPDIISMNFEDSLSWWSNEATPLQNSVSPFTQITSMIGIDENQLFMGTYDRDLARKRMLGDYASLPQRYLESQYSFLITSDHIIRYMTLTRGQYFTDQVLYSLNVSPLIYSDLTAKINLTYFADLLEILTKRGFTQKEMDTLASVMFLSLRKTALGKSFERAEDMNDIYSTLAKNYDCFDSNFEYKSEFVGKKYILKTVMHLNPHEQLKSNPASLKRLMRYRHILLAWFPYLAGMSPLFPKAELESYSDVVEMKYEFDLSHPRLPKRLQIV